MQDFKCTSLVVFSGTGYWWWIYRRTLDLPPNSLSKQAEVGCSRKLELVVRLPCINHTLLTFGTR